MQRVVIISAFHDYRTAKRASIHKVADGLVEAGYDVSFLSTRFSWLSKRTGDSRLFLWGKSNRLETVNGVRCFLWRTSLHPFRSGNALVDRVCDWLYPLYSELPNAEFDRLIAAADYVLVESSAAAIYVRRIRRLNRTARIIYYAADRLDTVGAHPFIGRRLVQDQALINHFSLRSTGMKEDFGWAVGRLYKAGFGIDERDYKDVGSSPYAPGSHVAVSVGSMLFDPNFFLLAAPHFPDLQFHVIGCGTHFDAPANVHLYGEMPFERTLAFVKHASIGLAPYRSAKGAEYLAESSLKLAQFDYLGIPAVCPHFAVGAASHRIGYEPSDEGSIRAAVITALARIGTVEQRSFPSWEKVALQVIEPERYGASAIG